MSPGAVAINVLQFASIVGLLLAAFRLYTARISRRYRYFFIFLLFSAVQITVLMLAGVRSGLYMKIWIVTEPLLWILYVAVVLELYRLVLEQYRGIYTLGRWALYFSITTSVFLSALTLLPRLDSPAFLANRLLSYYFVIERGLVCSLVLFLVLILVLLRGFPVRLSRNIIIHCFLYSLLFLSNTLALLLRGLFGWQISQPVNLLLMSITAICVLMWAILLNAKGEARLVSVSGINPLHEERILTKLNSLNSTVLKVSRN
jgi:hypothetical protein